jgi:hypothetical protein
MALPDLLRPTDMNPAQFAEWLALRNNLRNEGMRSAGRSTATTGTGLGAGLGSLTAIMAGRGSASKGFLQGLRRGAKKGVIGAGVGALVGGMTGNAAGRHFYRVRDRANPSVLDSRASDQWVTRLMERARLEEALRTVNSPVFSPEERRVWR